MTNANKNRRRPRAFDIDFQGLTAGGGEVFVGNNDDNFFNGKASVDLMTGGTGNDVFFHALGDGADIIVGGSQTTMDVLLVAGQGGFNAASAVAANETVSVTLDGSDHITTIDTASVSASSASHSTWTAAPTRSTTAATRSRSPSTSAPVRPPASAPLRRRCRRLSRVSQTSPAVRTMTLFPSFGNGGVNTLKGGDGADTFTCAASAATSSMARLIPNSSDTSLLDQANYSGNLSTYQGELTIPSLRLIERRRPRDAAG